MSKRAVDADGSPSKRRAADSESKRERNPNARFPRISSAEANDSVGTSAELFSDLHALFKFTYDPVPLNGLATPGVPDALKTPWGMTTFINPPFSNIAHFLAMAVSNLTIYGTRSVFLMPAHVETVYWDSLVWDRASEVWYCHTGLRFEGFEHKFSLPMAIVLYGSFGDVLPAVRRTGDRLKLGENYWYVTILPTGELRQKLRIRDRQF